jgi:hypothetical protein
VGADCARFADGANRPLEVVEEKAR